jgi:hypothetical protein
MLKVMSIKIPTFFEPTLSKMTIFAFLSILFFIYVSKTSCTKSTPISQPCLAYRTYYFVPDGKGTVSQLAPQNASVKYQIVPTSQGFVISGISLVIFYLVSCYLAWIYQKANK